MKIKKCFPKFQTFIITVLAVIGILVCGQSARAQVPSISNVSPNGAVQFQPSAALTFNASSSAGIATSAISVQLTGTSLPGQTFVTTLTIANGLIVGGTSTSRNISAPLTNNTVYTAVIQVTDGNNHTTNSTVTFDTITPAYTFEAEDFDYNSGHFIDNPQTNAYYDYNSSGAFNAVSGVDAFYNGGGGRAYGRTGLSTEAAGDKQRSQYTVLDPRTGQKYKDFDCGNASVGSWGNYTRTFPAGAYNIYMRAADAGGGNSGNVSMYLMTGHGPTKLGTFSVPSTGGWQTYTYVPLLDGGGNLVQFTGGAVETLRATTDKSGYNANFYLLMPANTTVPSINNIYPDGSDRKSVV